MGTTDFEYTLELYPKYACDFSREYSIEGFQRVSVNHLKPLGIGHQKKDGFPRELIRVGWGD